MSKQRKGGIKREQRWRDNRNDVKEKRRKISRHM